MSSRSVQILGDDRSVAKVDTNSGHLIAMSEIHARIHEGTMFSVDQVDTALADTASLTYLISTSASQSAHLRVLAALGGDARLQFFENPTVTMAGSAVTPINRNRFSSNVAASTVTTGPTVSSDGTELLDIILPGGSGFFLSPGSSGNAFEEYILKLDEDYLARVTNISGSAQPASLQLDFYEP